MKNENVWCLTLSIAFCTLFVIINLLTRVIFFHFHAPHHCHKQLVIATCISNTKRLCTGKNLWCSNVCSNRCCYNNVFSSTIFDNKHLGTFTKIGGHRSSNQCFVFHVFVPKIILISNIYFIRFDDNVLNVLWKHVQ